MRMMWNKLKEFLYDYDTALVMLLFGSILFFGVLVITFR